MKIRILTAALLAMLVMLPSCGDDKVDDPAPVTPPTTTDPTPDPDPTPSETEVSLEVPDKDGANIKGVVYCGKKALAGVAVSDGDKVVITDADGRYYINSTKRHGSVFVSIPTGYFPKSTNCWPEFYGILTKDASTVEQFNFELEENAGTDYVVIGVADIHLAAVRNTVNQYNTTYLPDIQRTVQQYKAEGKDVYVITLGDESHDLYWYGTSCDAADLAQLGGVPIALGDTKPYLAAIGAKAVFNSMGNHDNDPYVADDFLAEHTFREVYGPTHYSFNIAGTHYVILDNIVYVNDGGTQGSNGSRNYNQYVTDEQLAWLRNDLATVPRITPVVIGMHSMLWNKAVLPKNSQTPTIKYHITNAADLVSCLSGYNVTVLSGHNHVNSSTRVDNIVEYNLGSGAGCLWESGQDKFGKIHICKDGSGGGYYVMEYMGKNYKAYYKSVGYDRDYQFRTYDLNECTLTAAKYCPNSADALITATIDSKYISDYMNRKDNVVRINVFGFNEKWSIKVTENGRKLTTTRVNAYDPLWTIAVPCKQLNNRATPSSFPTESCHFFDVTASSASSTLVIEVTDEFGQVYTETMTRPKALSLDMK